MTNDDTDLHDDVTIRPLNDIVPYGENPKKHPQEQVDKIASSIQRFGWDQPIVVDAVAVHCSGVSMGSISPMRSVSSVML